MNRIIFKEAQQMQFAALLTLVGALLLFTGTVHAAPSNLKADRTSDKEKYSNGAEELAQNHGESGMVLMKTRDGVRWVATSTLGMGSNVSPYFLGRVGIGTNEPASTLEVATTFTETDGDNISYGGSVLAEPTSDSSAAYSDISTGIETAGTADMTGGVWGGYIWAGHGGLGTLTELNGVESSAYNIGAGTVENLYGLKVGDFINNGTIENTYGVYVEDISLGTQTNVPYSFYASDANAYSYFGGAVGIGTTEPTAQLSTTGSVRFSHFGMGTLQTDSEGNIFVSSDSRLKDIQGEFTRGMDALRRITPVTYTWKEKSGLDTASTYAGFNAQNVQESIPEAVGIDSDGFLTLSDRPILATLVNAVKEQQRTLDEFVGTFVGGALNVAEIISDRLTTKELKTDRLCVDDVCVDGETLRRLIENSKNDVN